MSALTGRQRDQWAAALLERFTVLYGASKLMTEWAPSGGVDSLRGMMRQWVDSIVDDYGPEKGGLMIKLGLSACEDRCKWPPTLPEFRIEAQTEYEEHQVRQKSREIDDRHRQRAIARSHPKLEGPAGCVEHMTRAAATEEVREAMRDAVAIDAEADVQLTVSEKLARHHALLADHRSRGLI